MAAEEPKQQECPPGAPVWMCTFADLMSLLLCFFVLLLSFSVMDAQRYKQVAGSMKDAFGIQRETRVTGSPSGDVMVATDFLSTPLAVKIQQNINEEIAEEIKSGIIETELTHDGVLVRMKDSVAFDLGKAVIKENGKTILDKIGKVIAGVNAKITVSGHTDNIPLKKGGPYSSNWSLSTARAVAVVEYWSNQFKIPTHRMSAAGYAEGHPLESNDTEAGRAANRRVEFKIQANQTSMSMKELSDMLIQK
jgi:chemotaxis protein MotB